MVTDWQEHLKQVKALTKSFADPCPATIYHYTSGAGFHGIIESGELWLTNTEFVNDTTDCRALREEQALFGIDELSSINGYVDKWWKLFLRDSHDSTYYIASFSKNPDSLEQWRAYGNVCIGFDTLRLEKPGFSLYECVYDKSAIKKWLLDKAKADGWLLSQPDRTPEFHADMRDFTALDLIFAAQVKLKHRCYENEAEVRLFTTANHDTSEFSSWPFLYADEPPIHFRTRPGFDAPVPYVKYFRSTGPQESCDSPEKYQGKTPDEVKREKREEEAKLSRDLLPITEIWLGPSPQQDQAKRACEILLMDNGYKDVKIEKSELPFRRY